MRHTGGAAATLPQLALTYSQHLLHAVGGDANKEATDIALAIIANPYQYVAAIRQGSATPVATQLSADGTVEEARRASHSCLPC